MREVSCILPIFGSTGSSAGRYAWQGPVHLKQAIVARGRRYWQMHLVRSHAKLMMVRARANSGTPDAIIDRFSSRRSWDLRRPEKHGWS